MVKYFVRIFIALSAIFVFLTVTYAVNHDYKVSINLSAHIIDSSVANLKDTKWTLYKNTIIEGNDPTGKVEIITTKQQEFTGSVKSLMLSSGQYVIRAQYGNAVVAKVFKFDETIGKPFLNLKLVFNLGALKLSSTIGNNHTLLTQDVRYVIRDIKSQKIVFETSDASKTYFLNQGNYNITAYYKNIIVTEANIRILANNLNLINISHQVGQINLNVDNVLSSIKDIAPTWRILGAQNRIDKEYLTTKNTEVQLPVGDYQLIIEWNNTTYTREFSILPAQIIEFKLPKE